MNNRSIAQHRRYARQFRRQYAQGITATCVFLLAFVGSFFVLESIWWKIGLGVLTALSFLTMLEFKYKWQDQEERLEEVETAEEADIPEQSVPAPTVQAPTKPKLKDVPETAIKYWDGVAESPSEIIIFKPDSLQELKMPEAHKAFLCELGLPESAAPFLNFDAPSEALVTVDEQWGLGNEFGKYAIIGMNGNGDPVAITTDGTGAVVYLNHDNEFQLVFMNSSVQQLAESLKAYASLVSQAIEKGGPQAFISNDIPAQLSTWLEDKLREIDSAALAKGTHWAIELQNLKAGKNS